MLQQTQVRTVHAYFLDFVARWPDVGAMAQAPADNVMKAWAGLGYYSRARNLKRCAEEVWLNHGGRFPQTALGLQVLPGIGAYTAAAIAAIAFDEPIAVVDGNVERVMARLMLIEEPMPQGKELVRTAVQAMLARERPGDFAQAMMDLGATLCSPRNPACSLCPLLAHCAAAKAGVAAQYPRKLKKAQKPQRRGAAYVLQNGDGEVLLQRRPDKGLLGGMAGVPTTDWTVRADGGTGIDHAPMRGDWRMSGTVRHVFTHFELELEVWSLRTGSADQTDGWWVRVEALGGEALPSVMKKVIAASIPEAFSKSASKDRR
jgi:A/G-specific adenine glycosylase